MSSPAPKADPSTTTTMLSSEVLIDVMRSVFAATPLPENATEEQRKRRRHGALQAFLALKPRDAIEAMYAAHIVICGYTVPECFSRAALPDVPQKLAAQFFGRAHSLTRAIQASTRALEKAQMRLLSHLVGAQEATDIGAMADAIHAMTMPAEAPQAAPSAEAQPAVRRGDAAPARKDPMQREDTHPRGTSRAAELSGQPTEPQPVGADLAGSQPAMPRAA